MSLFNFQSMRYLLLAASLLLQSVTFLFEIHVITAAVWQYTDMLFVSYKQNDLFLVSYLQFTTSLTFVINALTTSLLMIVHLRKLFAGMYRVTQKNGNF